MRSYKEGDLLGNIFAETPPPIKPSEVIIDLEIAKEIARQREIFEKSVPDTDNGSVSNNLTSPHFVGRFRRELGAGAEDEALLFRFMSNSQPRKVFSDLRQQDLNASGRILNAISRCGIRTVGDLRNTDIGSLFSRRDRIASMNGLSISSVVAAQTAFKPFDTPGPVRRS